MFFIKEQKKAFHEKSVMRVATWLKAPHYALSDKLPLFCLFSKTVKFNPMRLFPANGGLRYINSSQARLTVAVAIGNAIWIMRSIAA